MRPDFDAPGLGLFRATAFETFEEKLPLTAQPVGDFLLEEIEHRPELHYGELAPALADAHETTGLYEVQNAYGLFGEGQTVAVIDSGIAWDHAALGGGFGANYRVVGGWDFAENDANPYDDGPAGFHGTHVAGIVGSDNAVHQGVSSEVDLVALRVFDDNGAGYFSWVEDALNWVHENRDAFENPITTVNLSLGTTWNADATPGWAMLEDEFAQLHADGIFVAVSAGNSFTTYNEAGLSYPAASPYVVPVASVDNDGSMSYFSQRNSRVLAAPGRSIQSTIPDHVLGADGVVNDFGTASGTSMAAPYAAGASVLVREGMELAGYENITQDTIYDHLRNTADIFYDPATNANYHRINIAQAIDALMPADDFGSTVASAHHLGNISESNVSGMISRLDDVDYFSFTASVTGAATLSAETTHGMTAQWVYPGGSGQGSTGTFSFDVVAGQTYSVGLSTADRLGHFTLDVKLEGSGIDLATSAGSRSFVENAAPAVVDAGLSITGGAQRSAAYSATATITGNYRADQDRLTWSDSGNVRGVISGNRLSFQVVAGQTATADDFQRALRTVRYQNLSDNPVTSSRSIEFGFSDGSSTARAARSVQVVAINDAPELAGNWQTLAYQENAGRVAVDSSLRLTDVDNASASDRFSATVEISGNYRAGQDQLGFQSTQNIRGQISGNRLTLSVVPGQTATIADFQTALRSVTFQNISNDPDTSARTVSFTFRDGQLSDSMQRSVQVAAVNDAPEVVAAQTSVDYQHGSGAVAVDSRLRVSDIDSRTTSRHLSASVSIAGNYTAGDTLRLGPSTNIVGNFSGGTLTLTVAAGQVATVADFEAALRTVTFENSANDVAAGTRRIDVRFSDGQLADSVQLQLNVHAADESGIDVREDWGTVDFVRHQGTAQQGETWYAVQASRSGQMTVEALFAHASGNVDLEIYNSDHELMATSDGAVDLERVDVSAAAGDRFFVLVKGTNADVDFRITNLVSQSGAVVSVAGTSGYDRFEFTAGATHVVQINGVDYEFAANRISKVSFAGEGTHDTFKFHGTAANESILVGMRSASIAGGSIRVEADNVGSVEIDSGAGRDSLVMNGSEGNDYFTVTPDQTYLYSNGFHASVTGASSVRIDASGGRDSATVYDTAGNDYLALRPDSVTVVGSNYYVNAGGLERIFVSAQNGGNDMATIYDTDGGARVQSNSFYTSMRGSGYSHFVMGVERVSAWSPTGGFQRMSVADVPDTDPLSEVTAPETATVYYGAARRSQGDAVVQLRSETVFQEIGGGIDGRGIDGRGIDGRGADAYGFSRRFGPRLASDSFFGDPTSESHPVDDDLLALDHLFDLIGDHE